MTFSPENSLSFIHERKPLLILHLTTNHALGNIEGKMNDICSELYISLDEAVTLYIVYIVGHGKRNEIRSCLV